MCVCVAMSPSPAGRSDRTDKENKQRNRGRRKHLYDDYMSIKDVSDGLKRGELLQVHTHTLPFLIVSVLSAELNLTPVNNVVNNACLFLCLLIIRVR